MTPPVRIAVLVSGGGTNLQALLDTRPDNLWEITLVVSSTRKAYALERARLAGVETAVLPPKTLGERFAPSLLGLLREKRIDLVVLAGYLTLLPPDVVHAYEGRILNVHPALLPSFGGTGFYGLRVHEAALARGVKVTGATVHLVNEEPDGGPILLQKAVDVLPGDTPETLQRRVMEEAEWVLLPQAVRMLCEALRTKNQPFDR